MLFRNMDQFGVDYNEYATQVQGNLDTFAAQYNNSVGKLYLKLSHGPTI